MEVEADDGRTQEEENLVEPLRGSVEAPFETAQVWEEGSGTAELGGRMARCVWLGP